MANVHERMRNMVIRNLALQPKGKGVALKLIKTVDGEFDPTIGAIVQTTKEYNGSGVRVNYSAYTMRNFDIPCTDYQIYLSPLQSPPYAGSLSWYAGTQERYIGEEVPNGTGVPIIFNGITYSAWPCQVEGIEFDSSGQPVNPTLSVGNIDGTISSLCLFFDDLLKAKVTIRQTLSKYLDSDNFTTPNPDADPTQQITETWYIDAKTAEDNQTISWRLSSPADVSGMIIPARLITGMCHWCLTGGYRGPDCGYVGAAMFTENDEPDRKSVV